MVTDTDLSWYQVADECRPTFKNLRSRNPSTCRLLHPFLWNIVSAVEEPIEIPAEARAVIFPHLFSHIMMLLEASWKFSPNVDVFGAPSSGGTYDGNRLDLHLLFDCRRLDLLQLIQDLMLAIGVVVGRRYLDAHLHILCMTPPIMKCKESFRSV